MIAAGLLAGCLSLAPPHRRPPLPVDTRFPADAPATAGLSTADGSALDWRQVFTDPDLQRAIEDALHGNRDLRRSVLRVQEARAQRRVQSGALWPGVNADAIGLRTGSPETEALGLPGVIGAYTAALSASWEPDFWGRLRDLDAAAREGYLASDAARRAFEVSLAAQVANAWLQQCELDERIVLARQSMTTRAETLRIFRRRYEEGSGSKLEVTQAQALLTQAQSLASQLEQGRAAGSHALALLTGGVTPGRCRTDALEGHEAVQIVQSPLSSTLLTQRPDVIAAEHRLKAAQASIGAARAAFFPQITLTGSLGVASTQLDGLFGSGGGRTWSFLPIVTVPVFEGGRLRASLDLAKIRRDISITDYEAAVQGAFRDVADALSAHQQLREQAGIARTALEAATERARLAQLRYDAGSATYLEVLDAQRDLLAAQQALVQTQRALLTSRVNLFAALGGGTLGEGR